MLKNISHAPMSDPRVLLLDDDIDGSTDQRGRGEVKNFIENRADDRLDDLPAILAGVAEQAEERVRSRHE